MWLMAVAAWLDEATWSQQRYELRPVTFSSGGVFLLMHPDGWVPGRYV